MTLKYKAVLGLASLFLLAACGPLAPQATPTPTATQTLEPTLTATARPSETPQPSATPDIIALTAEAGTPDPLATSAAPTSAAANPSAGGSAPEAYTFLGQDIPDRTQFLPNRTVTITWTIKNTGTVGWTKDYTLRYFAGPKAAEDVYTFSKDVPVNDTINFSVTFTTPADPGEYDMWFKLTNNASQNFGDLDLVYTVSNSPVKATSTPGQ